MYLLFVSDWPEAMTTALALERHIATYIFYIYTYKIHSEEEQYKTATMF